MRWFVMACGLAVVADLQAQINVTLSFPQEQFLAGETLQAIVRISNLSGQTLTFGREADWLTFVVEAKNGFLVTKAADLSVQGEFELESSSVATKRVDLMPAYHFKKLDRYSVTATVKVAPWERVFTSPPARFDLVTATKLWEEACGVPPPFGATNTVPQIRKYTLLQANYRQELRLYLRLSDGNESRILTTFPLGPMLSVSRPEAQVDKFSNLHVLHQTGAKAFSYVIINPEGRLVVRETHDYTATRPRLGLDPEGRIVIRGGVRRLTDTDLPAPSPPPATNAPSPGGS